MTTPESFNDALASTIDWSPVSAGGSNFATHTLVADGDSRMSFWPTRKAQAGWLFLILFGSFIPLGLGYSWYQSGEPPLVFVIFTSLVCSGFVFAGFIMKQQITALVCFDKATGSVELGQVVTDAAEGFDRDRVLLEQVYALQMIEKRKMKSMESVGEYYSGELNLVLQDGTRVNIADHGDLPRLRKDAKTLSNFLDCPLWDVTSAS